MRRLPFGVADCRALRFCEFVVSDSRRSPIVKNFGAIVLLEEVDSEDKTLFRTKFKASLEALERLKYQITTSP